MFRDLKEYQEIAKIYAEKVSKPEDLEERVRGGGMKSSLSTPKPVTVPQKGAGGGVGNPTNVRGSGARNNRPKPEIKKPEIKKFPTTAEIRAANQGRVGGGNAGGSTDSGGTSQSTIKSVEQKPEVETKPEVKKPKMGSPDSKYIKKDKGVGFVKRGTAPAQRAENKEKAKLRAQAMAKARIEAKKKAEAEMSNEEFTPYDYVLEYLLSSEQAATIEEANYVMTEMDAKTIQGIVEAQKKILTEKPGDGYIGPKFLNIKNPITNYINKKRNQKGGGNYRVDEVEKNAGVESGFAGEKIKF